MPNYMRWAGSGALEAIVAGVNTFRRVVHDQVRKNINAAHARGSKGGQLATSRITSVTGTGEQEHPDRCVDVRIDWRHIEGLSVKARVELKTDNAATSVTPRIKDMVNNVDHDGVACTNTSWEAQEVTIAAPAALAVIDYRFYLVKNNATHEVYGVGAIDVFDALF